MTGQALLYNPRETKTLKQGFAVVRQGSPQKFGLSVRTIMTGAISVQVGTGRRKGTKWPLGRPSQSVMQATGKRSGGTRTREEFLRTMGPVARGDFLFALVGLVSANSVLHRP